MLYITTLMDNESSEHRALVNNHGLSLHIAYNGKKYLFDCGSNDEFINNAYRLGVDLDDIDAVILSHNHYDHASGYRDYADNKKYAKRLYTGANFFENKYATCDNIKYCNLSSGLDKNYISSLDVEHITCDKYLQIDEGIYIMGGFKSQNDFETIPDRFVKLTENGMKKDDFTDELALIIESHKGLIVIVGCSHPGILSILMYIREHFKKDIYAVFGGTHLVEADDERIVATAKICKDMGIEILGLSHCSGLRAEEIINKTSSIRTCHLAVGDCLII